MGFACQPRPVFRTSRHRESGEAGRRQHPHKTLDRCLQQPFCGDEVASVNRFLRSPSRASGDVLPDVVLDEYASAPFQQTTALDTSRTPCNFSRCRRFGYRRYLNIPLNVRFDITKPVLFYAHAKRDSATNLTSKKSMGKDVLWSLSYFAASCGGAPSAH